MASADLASKKRRLNEANHAPGLGVTMLSPDEVKQRQNRAQSLRLKSLRRELNENEDALQRSQLQLQSKQTMLEKFCARSNRVERELALLCDNLSTSDALEKPIQLLMMGITITQTETDFEFRNEQRSILLQFVKKRLHDNPVVSDENIIPPTNNEMMLNELDRSNTMVDQLRLQVVELEQSRDVFKQQSMAALKQLDIIEHDGTTAKPVVTQCLSSDEKHPALPDMTAEISQLKKALDEAQTLCDIRLKHQNQLEDALQKARITESEACESSAQHMASVLAVEIERDACRMQLNEERALRESELQSQSESVADFAHKLTLLKEEHQLQLHTLEARIQELQHTHQQSILQTQRDELCVRTRLEECNAKLKRLKELEHLSHSQHAEITRLRQIRARHNINHAVIHSDTTQSIETTSVQTNGAIDEVQNLREEMMMKEKKWKETERDLRLLLDSFRSVSKEKRDIVRIRAEENKCRQDLVKVEKELQSFRALGSANDQISLAQQLQTQVETANSMMSEVDELEQQYNDMEEQNTRLLAQIVQMEEHNIKLVTQQMKQEAIERNVRKELMLSVKRGEEITSSVAQYVARDRDLTHEAHALKTALSKTQEELRASTLIVEMHRKTASEATEKLFVSSCAVHESTARLRCRCEYLEREVQGLNGREKRIRRLEEKLLLAHKRLGQTSGSANDVGVETELQNLKLQLKCSVCQDNNKNVVITKCFHCFCRSCIEENLKIRHRKCPGCGLSFGADDVHNIYLT